MFNWIRSRVRDAVIAGCQDAIDELTATAKPTVLNAPEPRLLRLPGPEPEGAEEVAPRRKKTS